MYKNFEDLHNHVCMLRKLCTCVHTHTHTSQTYSSRNTLSSEAPGEALKRSSHL